MHQLPLLRPGLLLLLRRGPSSRFRPPGTVLGAQAIFSIVNPYRKYFLGPDNVAGGIGIARAGRGDAVRLALDARARRAERRGLD